MKTKTHYPLLFALLLTLFTTTVVAEPYITTFAGTVEGYIDGPARLARFDNPWGITRDKYNNVLYIADPANHRIRKLDLNTGMVTTVAGNGTPGHRGNGGPAQNAQLQNPVNVEIDKNGHLYIADLFNRQIRMVNASDNTMTTIAGDKVGNNCDDGLAVDADFVAPVDVALYENNGQRYLYVADLLTFCVRRIDLNNGTIKKVAGAGPDGSPYDLIQDNDTECNNNYGYDLDDDCPVKATDVNFDQPSSIAVDSVGNLYIGDGTDYVIYKVDTAGYITIVATLTQISDYQQRYVCDPGLNTETILHSPAFITIDDNDNIYATDSYDNVICRFNTDGTITAITPISDFSYGGDFGVAKEAGLNQPTGLIVDSTGNTLYFTDKDNHRIRKITGLLPSDDTQPPVVVIAYPKDQDNLENLPQISGTVVDEGDGLGDIGIQFKLETTKKEKEEEEEKAVTLYLGGDNQLREIEDWVSPANASNWSYDTSSIPFPEGQYTITVRAFDKAGNKSQDAVVTGIIGKRMPTTLSLRPNSQTILQNAPLSITGKLIRFDEPDIGLSGQTITLNITDPENNQVILSDNTNTTDALGNYLFNIPDNVFKLKGHYTLNTEFSGNTQLLNTPPTSQSVLVGSSAGYAIIIQGSLTIQEGMAAYNKTLNRVYQRLLDRGFEPDNIYYFNNDASQSQVDAIPNQADIQDAIETWAQQRINGSPAPLYIIMVDHGNPGVFYLGNEMITPANLNSWLNNLETGLNETALKEPRVVIIGACYSGSFIPELSKTGRTIITSAADTEVSYKGLKEKDGIRSGEFFIEEFSQQLWRGLSLKNAFEKATASTEMFTRSGLLSANTANPYLDDAMQHPLLDDNGDKQGSNVLSTDGQQAVEIFLGVGVDYQSNDSENPADILDITPSRYLTDSQTSAVLFLTANEPKKVDGAGQISIRPPSKILHAQNGTEQIDIDLETQFLPYNSKTKRFEGNYNGFTEYGMYEIFYTVRDSKTQQISLVQRSVVYKDKPGNQPPTAPELKTPVQDKETATVLPFDWAPSNDPNQDPISYQLVIAEDEQFEQNVVTIRNLSTSMTFINESIGLKDLTDYYWRAEAIDHYGAKSVSQTGHFKTNNGNYYFTAVNLAINSDLYEPVRVLNHEFQITHNNESIQPNMIVDEAGGHYLFILPEPGLHHIEVNTPGFQPHIEPIEVMPVLLPSQVNSGLNLGIPILQRQIILTRDCQPSCNSHGYLQFLTSDNVKINEDEGRLTLYVERLAGYDGPISVNYRLTDGTAQFGNDYSSNMGISGTLTWHNNDAQTKPIVVLLNDDKNREGNETFSLVLSEPTGGATLGQLIQTQVTILDNEQPDAGILSFSKNHDTVNENAGTVTLSVTRKNGSYGEISVGYFTSPMDTSTLGDDYSGGNGVLLWQNGETGSQTITINIADDTQFEADETFTTRLFHPTGNAKLSADSQATFTIVNDDEEVPIDPSNPSSIAQYLEQHKCSNQPQLECPTPETSASQTESSPTKVIVVQETTPELNYGNLLFQYNNYRISSNKNKLLVGIIRTNGTDGEVSVTITTEDNTALADMDYVHTEGTLSWQDGEGGKKTFAVDLLDNSSSEEEEKTFTLTLSDPSDGAIIDETRESVEVTIVHQVAEILSEECPQEPEPVLSEPELVIHEEKNEGPLVILQPQLPMTVTTIPESQLQFVQTDYRFNENANEVEIEIVRHGNGEASVEIVAIADSSATLEEDYRFIDSQTVHWEYGENNTKTITLLLIDDDETENDETVNLRLVNPNGAKLGEKHQATLTIMDNDPQPEPVELSLEEPVENLSSSGEECNVPAQVEIEVEKIVDRFIEVPLIKVEIPVEKNPGQVQFLAPRQTVKEGRNQTLSLKVDRSDGCDGEISVNLIATNDSTAKPMQDYKWLTDTLTWADGECDTTQSFTLNLVDDQIFEQTEKLILRLQPVTEGLRFGKIQQLEITIEDNDEESESVGWVERSETHQTPVISPTLDEESCSTDVTEEPSSNLCQKCEKEEAPSPNKEMTLPHLGQGITLDGNQTEATFRGGIAVDGKIFQSRVWLTTNDEVEIQAEIEPHSEHIGEKADILIVAHHQLMFEQQWFMKDNTQNIQLWDGISDNLVAVETNVKLESTQQVNIYSGLLPPGQLKIYFGYRLQNGLIVFNGEQAIRAIIENKDKASL